jgi:hypothetical protein
MYLLDEQYTQTPFYGVLRMTTYLRRLGYAINEKHVQRLLREMGLFSIYTKTNLSKQNQIKMSFSRHKHSYYCTYPQLYLLHLSSIKCTWPDIVKTLCFKNHFKSHFTHFVLHIYSLALLMMFSSIKLAIKRFILCIFAVVCVRCDKILYNIYKNTIKQKMTHREIPQQQSK